MESIVRREPGEDWRSYVIGLMRAEGIVKRNKVPSDEEIRRLDKNRKGKSLSNEDWVSGTDAEAKIAKMKDGTTHLAYAIPALQMFLSLGLMFGELKRYAIASASLLLLFSVAQGSAMFRGIDLSCGCFSSSGGERIGLATLSIPLGLGLTLLAAVVCQRQALTGSFQHLQQKAFARS